MNAAPHGPCAALATALPPAMRDALESLRVFDEATVDLALGHLERHACRDGGAPLGAEVVRRLGDAPLSPAQQGRVAALILRGLRHGSATDFRHCARLAPRVLTPTLKLALEVYARLDEPLIARRARHALRVLRSNADESPRGHGGTPDSTGRRYGKSQGKNFENSADAPR